MGKQILLTIAGIGAVAIGILLLYFFLISLSTNGNYFYFTGSLLLTGLAVYLFIRVTNNTPNKAPSSIVSVSKEDIAKTFEEKNKLINQYGKIERTRAQLKMLEAAGSSASDASK